MNKLVTALVVMLVVGMGYVFYQYQIIASEADEQVEKDIAFLEETFRERTSEALSGDHEKEKYIQTALIFQSVNDEQQFVRHYHSLFIENGVRNCLHSQIVYFQMQPKMFKQTWLESTESCLP